MDSTQSEREAADWLARRDSGRWSTSDEAAFADWQNRSTANRVAVIRLKTVWREADRLQALGAGLPAGEVPPPGTWRLSRFIDSRRPPQDTDPVPAATEEEEPAARTVPGVAISIAEPRRYTVALRALAASLLLVLVGSAVWYWGVRDPGVYHTPVGGLKSVAMADGSTVTLNTATAIRVAVTPKERDVVLEKGEAFFEVAHDVNRPFVVRAGDQRIIAVGTRFSVLREIEGSRVVVTQGLVRVEDGGSAPGPATPVPAGSIAEAGAAGVLVRHATLDEAQAYVAWRQGYISLHETSLAEAVAEFNRYNKKQLVIRDPQLAEIKVGGNLRATNLAAFARVLEQGFPVHATDEGDEIVLTAR